MIVIGPSQVDAAPIQTVFSAVLKMMMLTSVLVEYDCGLNMTVQ